MHMFRIYILSFTANKVTEKAELTKKATGKTAAFLCGHYDNCLDAINDIFPEHQTKY